eukprot:gene993-biopygen3220
MARAWRRLQAIIGLGWRVRGAGMARAWRGHFLFPQVVKIQKKPGAFGAVFFHFPAPSVQFLSFSSGAGADFCGVVLLRAGFIR